MKSRENFRERNKVEEYSPHELTVAKELTKQLKKELGEFLQGVILFGSTVTSPHTQMYEKDIDILILINDMTKILNPEVVEAYRIIVHNTAASLSDRFHINTLKLTDFWEYVRHGDPIIINMLRSGHPLHDTGVFKPAQAMLEQGRIKPSKENIWKYYMQAPTTITNSKWHILQATIDLYWATIDAAHALLISQGEAPLTPKHISSLMMQYAKRGRIKKSHAKIVDEFYLLTQAITEREIKEITGAEYEKYYKKAKGFIDEIMPLVKEHKKY